GNRMSKHSEEIKIDDTSTPSIPPKSVLKFEDRGETAIITIDFGRSMEVEGRYSVLDLDNYELHGKLLSEFEDEFDAFVDIDAYDDNEIVEIIIQDHIVSYGDEL